METPIEFQSKTLDLSDLYPIQAKKISVYASKPKTVKTTPDTDRSAAIGPSFTNTIKLQTLNSNLNLEFGFTNNLEQSINTPLSNIVMGSETAKQLLIALAELFQCDLNPKEKQ